MGLRSEAIQNIFCKFIFGLCTCCPSVIPAQAGTQEFVEIERFFIGGIVPSYVYILASQKNGTLYTGVTSDLIKRVHQHKTKEIKGFTSQYNVSLLVYYEVYEDIAEAILREKRIKKWNRAWKLRLIEKVNPYWKDLYASL